MEQGTLVPLPPKRFQSTWEPVYDVLRHKRWFADLNKRRAKLPLLQQAYARFMETGMQKKSSIEFGIDERELRDYVRFITKEKTIEPDKQRAFQLLLDHAYRAYCRDKAQYHLREYVRYDYGLASLNPRAVVEAWEVDANFYPTGYKPF